MASVTDDVAVLRRFTRYLTRRTGLLASRYLGQGRALGEARLLFEIGPGASLRDLRGRLGLDAGYLSRLIRSLEDEGLVRVSVDPHDSRLRVAELTRDGEAELAEQHRRANSVANSLLHGLDERQREELIGAIVAAERLLRLAAITIESVDPTSADARECLGAFASEIRNRFPEGFETTELVAPDEVSGDVGVFLVVREEGRPVGCGALRTLEPDVGEVRHVWVHPDLRGLGLGRRIVAALEAWAEGRGLAVVRLGTHETLVEAIQMYRNIGYDEVDEYGPIAHTHHWFEKHLGRSGLTTRPTPPGQPGRAPPG